ncbi:hypothetical protein CANCADRAFT_12669, partial [Tortispora caseinolytica NRRL Y-17796]
RYRVTAVGGTFDHLHAGHKILLTMAGFITSDRLIIGITGEALLKNKKYAEYLEDYSVRKKSVENFMNYVFPELKLDIYEIDDVYGPTAKEKDIDALVISQETVAGARMIQKVRAEKGWNTLKVWQIPVLGGSEGDGFKDKLSSTHFRKIEAEKHQAAE